MELRIQHDKAFAYKMKCIFHLIFGRFPENEKELIDFAATVQI